MINHKFERSGITAILPICTLIAVLFVSVTANADQTGYVFMVDTAISTQFVTGVERFTLSGQSEGRFGLTNSFTFTSVATYNGEIYVPNLQMHEIQRYSINGDLLGIITVPSIGDNVVAFMEFDSFGNLYLTDDTASNPVAYRFNSNGVITGTFSGPLNSTKNGIDAAQNGDVYIRQSSTFYRFSSNGTYLSSSTFAQIRAGNRPRHCN